MRAYWRSSVLFPATFWVWVVFLAGCASEQVIHANAPPASRAEQPPDQQRLVDVAIAVFAPGLSAEGESIENSGGYREIRRAEARYLPYTLKKTLDQSGQWGAVRLVPDSERSADVLVTGEIVESNGAELSVDVEIRDATGRVWLSRR